MEANNVCAAALLAELNRAMELLHQLESNPYCLDLCQAITPKVASSIRNSIRMVESFNAKAGHDRRRSSSLALRPRNVTPRRRISLRSWTSSVAGGVDGPGEDGRFTWRKYGQKEILGAKYPRAYFRCSRRFSHGCPAKKQVQRSNDDPSVYDVTYHDDHTCLQQPREEEQQQGGARGAMQHDQEHSAAALKLESEEFVGQIAASFGSVEEQFFPASPYQFGSFHGGESSLLPMEIDGDWEVDPDCIWTGVEWMP